MNAAPRPDPRGRFRALLPTEPDRGLLHLRGGQRLRMELVYVAIHLVVGGGLLAGLSWSPLAVLGGLVLAYIFEQLGFVLAHVGLHSSFMETPEAEMPTVTHHAFIHHYRDIRAYHRSWLASRLSYFFCPQRPFGTLTALGRTALPLVLAGGLALAVDWRAGATLLACLWANHLLQGVAHEWYHNDQRDTFYTPPMRWFLVGLEAVGVMDGKRHRRHHAHHLHSLDEVQDWVDLSLPGAEWLGRTLWRRQLRRYRAGERAMVPGIIGMYLVFLPLQFGTLLAFFAGMAAVVA